MKSALAFLAVSAMLAGCVTTTPSTALHQPMSVRPEARNAAPPVNGAIFNVIEVTVLVVTTQLGLQPIEPKKYFSIVATGDRIA